MGIMEKAQCTNAVNELKALGDALATMEENSDSVKNLGYMVTQKAEELSLILEVV